MLTARLVNRRKALIFITLLALMITGAFLGRTTLSRGRLNVTPIGGATNQTYLATASGSYTVVITDQTVSNTDDSGSGSLRDAIANVSVDGTINFDPMLIGQTITLTSGELVIDKNLTIQGPTTGGLTISGGSTTRIFNVNAGVNFTFSNLTISGGQATTGGGVNNLGNLTILNSTLSGNTATSNGGAILTEGGVVRIINSTISGNNAGSGGGGGLYNGGTSQTTITNSTIANNNEGIRDVSSNPLLLNNTLVGRNPNCVSCDEVDVFVDAEVPTATIDPASSNNLIGVDTGVIGISNGVNGNQIGSAEAPVDPLLGPLANNGGPTSTHALNNLSPAADTGNNALAVDQNSAALTTDQRGTGFPRIDHSVVDIGAYEKTFVPPPPNADVGVSKSAGSEESLADRDIVYTITVTNSGPDAAANVTLNDVLPGDLTFVSMPAPAGWSCTTPSAGTGGTVNCTNPNLAVGSVVGFTLTVHIPASSGETEYHNVATVSTTTNDLNSVNDSSSANVTIASCLTNPIVVSNADSGAGSLRQAIIDACDGSIITFDMNPVVSPITLTSGELLIDKNLTITGPGANLLTISGNNVSRVFNIQVSKTVGISGLTITNGNTLGDGGGVFNQGTLTLSACAVTNSSSPNSGGGVSNDGGTMIVISSTISGNTGSTAGGGIANGGTLTLINSTISGNTGDGLSNSNIANLTNDTFSGNTIRGITNNGSGTANVRNTIVANTPGAVGDVGGAFNSQGNNFIGKSDGSTGFANGVSNDKVGTVSSPLNALLAVLGNYGGPTQTQALLPGAPAIDAANNCVAEPAHCSDANIPQLETDQRGVGFARIVDGSDTDTIDTVDIGAFEALVSVEDITDKVTNEDTQVQFTFNVGSEANITSVTATSANTALVPNDVANIALSGSGSTRTLTINPAANQFGMSAITVTVNGANSQSMTDSFVLTVNAIAETPSVTNTTTNEDTQTTFGLVISRNPADGAEVTHFKISGITSGALFQNDGATPINNGDFITFTEGNAGLKFTPAASLFSPGTTFSFQVQGATSNTGSGLSSGFATATITVSPGADTPSVTNATTNEDVQTTSGLVISRNPGDGAEVTHFKITGITNGALFKNDGTTPINNGGFITFTEGNAGLKFTPAANLFSPGTTFSFQVQGATSGVGAGLSASFATATIAVNTVADTPSVTSATTNEDIQTTSGLVISRNAADGTEVTHFKISGITSGALFKNDGATPISNGDFITFAEGNAGLKFTPAANLFSPATSFSFQVQGATSNTGTGLSPVFATANITVNPVADTPSVTNATTTVNTQTTSGLVISRNAADSAEVTNFKITNITNGTLFKNDGTTQINNNQFITIAEGNAGLKFTPALNSNANGNFDVQASLDSNNSGLGGGTATATVTINCGSTVVTNGNDSGAGSLRDVILKACPGSTITFQSGFSTITLTSGEFLLNKNLTFQGPGANLLTIQRSAASGTSLFSVFVVSDPGVTTNISGLTLSNADRNANGGAIRNSGAMAINGVTLSNNHTTAGGSAIFNTGTGNLTLSNSTLSGNRSDILAAIYNQNGTMTISNSTLNGNTNLGSSPGTAIFSESNGVINLINCTISQNTGQSVAVFQNAGGTGQVNLKNSIVSGNTGGDVSGVTNNGNNLIGGTSLLAPLGDYGGPTQTMALLPGSPAINAGDNAAITNPPFGGPPFTDQRGTGFARIVNGTADIGAFESRGFNIAATSGTPQSVPIFGAFAAPLLATVSSTGGEPVAGGVVTFTAPASGASATFAAGVTIINLAINASGQASTSATANGAAGGPYNVTATGNGITGPANFSLTNLKANQTITFAALGNKTFGDADFLVSASASSSLAVAFAASGNCTVASPSPGTVHLTGAGSCTITASQAGDANYNPAANVPRSFSIAKGVASTAITSSVNPSFFGQSVTFTTTVTSGAGTPTGTVQFKDNGNNLGAPVALNASGVAQLTTSALTSLTHTITADYSGDANFLPSTGTLGGGQMVGSQPSLSINDVSVTEGNSGTKILSFTITLECPFPGPCLSADSNLPVSVDYATANGTASAPSDYVATSGTLTLNAPGELGRALNVTINGDISFEPDETFMVTLSNPVNATINKALGKATIQNDDALGGFISFSQANTNVNESTGVVTLTVTRGVISFGQVHTEDELPAANVDYATDDTGASTNCAALNTGLASQRCDYTSVFGTLKFAANETEKTIDIPINLDAYNEGPEVFTVKLSNPTGGAVALPATATVTINDSASPTANAIDETINFVRQQYRDFLNREADAAGLAFWTDNIEKCKDPARRPANQTLAQCIEVQRIVTSAAFFLSIEFKQTGGTVRDFYVAALDRPLTNNMPNFVEFMRDTQAIQKGVIVGQGNWQQVLDANRTDFMNEFVARAEFVGLYPTTDTPAQYVDKLYLHANVAPVSPQERLNAIGEFAGAATATDQGARGRALLRITQNANFQAREANRTFVQIEYFGYLRRDPDIAGYNFWVNKLNQFNGDFLQAEMVKAFLSSLEYRSRFGP